MSQADVDNPQDLEAERILEPEYYYPEDHVERVLEDSPLPNNLLQYYQSFGFDSTKRYNLHLIDEKNIIYISGASFYIYNMDTKEKKIFFSKDGAGIGSIAVHPSKEFFAVAEKGNFPNIYIYEYPSLRLKRILRKGTERSYSNITFSISGDKLASVGSSPDYQICVWDWMTERVLLKSKAFSQEVYRVSFSHYNDDILTTSGTGHIKFWKIAETFTGLKLKGDIAKFGQVELSDVTSFFIFPDEKNLSSTEYGKLLLWEGNMIKAVISIDQDVPCHDGAIESIFLDTLGVDEEKTENENEENENTEKLEKKKDKRYVVTAGHDGFIKFWDFDEINDAEGDDHGNYFIKPTKVIQVMTNENKPASILSIERSKDFWLVYDVHGYIWKLKLPSFEQEPVLETNAGKMMDLCTSSRVNAAVSIGEDGVVRLWDYVDKKERYNVQFMAKGTSLEWAPRNDANKGRVLYAGYSNGIMRILQLTKTGFVLLNAIKVHSQEIFKIKASQSGQTLVVATRSGSLFFLDIDASKPSDLEPFCLIEVGVKINDICWHENSKKVLLACDDGRVVEIYVPSKNECDTNETYLRDLDNVRMRSYTIMMMESQKPKHDEMEDLLLGWKDHKALKEKQDEEWAPASILSCSYLDAEGREFVCSVADKFLGYVYVCSFDQERPIMGISTPKVPIRSLRFYDGYSLMVSGLDDGTVMLKRKENFETHLVKLSHDRDYGKVRKVEFSFENDMCLTCAEDGTINAYLMDLKGLRQAANEQEYVAEHPTPSGGIPDFFFEDEVQNARKGDDILDDNIYSIQEDKLNTEEDNRKTLAEKKKHKVLEQIRLLQDKFHELLKKNINYEPSFRLQEDEVVVDSQYQDILENMMAELLEETRKELSWDLAYNELKANKLKQYFLEELHTERICMKSFDGKHKVNTFKVKNLSPYIEGKLEDINREIEEENRIQAEESSAQHKDTTINFDGESRMDDKSRKYATQASKSIMKGQMDKTDAGESDNKSKFSKQRPMGDQTANKTFGASALHQSGAMIPGQTQAGTAPVHQKYDRERAKKEEAERLAVKEELEKSMPTYEAFQPDHIKAINLEMEKLGDYKLKSSSDYIVPEDQRMNVEKKRKHIFLLYEVLFRSKKDFNEKILDLRKKKVDILGKMQKHNDRCKEIDKELNIEEEYFTAAIDPINETPEKYYDITDDVIDEYSKKKDAEKAANTKKDAFFGAGGAAPAGANPAATIAATGQPASVNPQVVENVGKKDDKPEKLAQLGKGNLIPIQTRDRKTKKAEESGLEHEIKLANEMRLLSEKENLKTELDSDIKLFDKQIIKLKEEKAVLEWNMKVVEMKLITFAQELIILEDMQEHDDQLINKLLNARKDKASFESQNADYAAQILEKKQNHFNVDKKLNETINEYNKYFLDDINRANKIFAYFQRMHKKRKNKEMNKKKDDEEGDEDNESDEEDESFDEEEDEEEKVDVSPVMNDPNLRKLVDNRNEYLDEKSQLEEDMNKLQNERRIIDNRLGQIDELIKNTESDLRDYQRQKLQRVNKLTVAHFLKLSQIQNLVKGRDAEGKEDPSKITMPEDLSKSILFTEKELNRLHNRIFELDVEKQEVLKQHEKLTKEKKKLTRGINEKNKECDEARKRYQEEHMLKFGDVIDFSVLDSLVPTKEVLQKREDFKKEEREAEKRVEEGQSKYLLTKKRLFEEKKENTRILNKITALGEKQMKLNKDLNSTNKQIFKEDNEDRKTNLTKEKSHLVELVRFLAKEIEDLKTEIALFKKKGGHIYTMVTSNKKTLEDII